MDSQQFDELTRALATGSSRRKVLKGLVAGVAGAVGLRRVAPANAATCRELGEACRSASDCCNTSGQTVLVCQKVGTTGATRCECDLTQGFVNCGGQCFQSNCPAGATFSCAGGCQCPSGSEFCTPTGGSQQCVVECPTGQRRSTDGTCGCECPAGQELCNGACVTSCAGGEVLVNCVCTCPTGTTTCTPTGGTAQCTTNCTGGQGFDANCQCVCPSGQELCGGQCVNLCPAGSQRNPDCTCGCPTGTVTCGGRCVTACTGGQIMNSSCQCVCPSGGELCQGTCHSTCATGQVRNATTCACACPTGTTTCGGQCVTACTNGLILNSSCQCVCPTVNNEAGIFCNGACHYNTECSGNKVFNAFCCSCQNPGQPSGRCK